MGLGSGVGVQEPLAILGPDAQAVGIGRSGLAERLAAVQFGDQWIGRGVFPDHPWRKYLQRSALTLKGLIYAPTGALLAEIGRASCRERV